MGGNTEPDWIDPDPITLSMLFIMAASLALQFIQIAKDGPTSSRAKPTRDGDLIRLETALEEALADLERAVRSVERGAKSPEKEFYEVKFRIGFGVMRLDGQWHGEYTTRLHHAFGKVTALTLFINNLIGQHPELAGRIGERMIGSLSGSADRLNQLIAEGATNGAIVAECRLVLMTCREIVSQLLSQREN